MNNILKIKIDLEDNSHGYMLNLTFLNVSHYFDCFKSISYVSRNRFKLRYNINHPLSYIRNRSIMIPNKNYINYELKKYFPTKESRYSYLKLLYECLNEWSLNKNGSVYEFKLSLKNNIWSIDEEYIYKNHIGISHLEKYNIRNNLL